MTPGRGNPEAVRILDGQRVLGPVRVGGLDRLRVEASRDGAHRVLIAEVQHEQRLGVGCGGAVPAARRELQMRPGAG